MSEVISKNMSQELCSPEIKQTKKKQASRENFPLHQNTLSYSRPLNNTSSNCI